MIPLRKHTDSHPKYGAAIRWLAARDVDYRAALRSGADTKKYLANYSDTRVKTALKDETADKCAYCEVKYGSASFGDVEHSLPRTNDENRLLQYANLTIACQVCNNRKRAYEDKLMPLIDPFQEDPTARILAYGPHLFPIPGTDSDERAANTLSAFRLNERFDLVGDRAKVVTEVVSLVNSYKTTGAPAVRDAALRRLRYITSRRGEFALTARAAMEHVLPEVPLDPLESA